MVENLHDYKTGQKLDKNSNKISPCPSLGLPLLRLFLTHSLATFVTQPISVAFAFTVWFIL